MLTIDADSERVIFGPGASQEITILKLKRRLVAALPVRFTRGLTVIELPNDAVGKIEFKTQHEFDCQPITGAQNWTKFGTGTGTYYVFLFALINAPLDRLFGYDPAHVFTASSISNILTAVDEHGLSIGDKLQFSSTVLLPTPLDFGKDYFAIADSFGLVKTKVSEITGGTEVDILNAGTGTHSLVRVSNDVFQVNLNCDIYWIHSGGTIEGKTQTLEAQIENDVTRAGDTIPGSPAIVYSHDSFWRVGSGVPSNSLGLDGDFYINNAVGVGYFDVYMRDSGVYSLVGNIKGAQGSQGFQGSQGNQGTSGAQGSQGNQGNQGNQGSQGSAGAQGNQGFQGAPGAQGNQGNQGAQGNQGFQGPSGGAQGAQGAQGSQGSQGNQGFQGNQGNQGTQGNQGFQGASGGGGTSYILIEDQKTTNTNGGDFNSGAWRTRTVNTEVADTGGNTSLVGTTQISLAAGTYRCRISAPAYSVGRHQTRLQDITNTATLLMGSSEYAASLVQTRSSLKGRFTLAGTTTIEIQHQCETTAGGGLGFGVSTNFGSHETYTQAEFEKE